MTADGRIDAAQVAVLAERVEQSLRNYDELRGMILAMNTRSIASDQKLAVHSFILRSMGVILLSSMGLIGWGWHQGQTLFATDQALDRRTLIIEYKLGLQQPSIGGKQ
jgi:hypothetical protein